MICHKCRKYKTGGGINMGDKSICGECAGRFSISVKGGNVIFKKPKRGNT